MNPNNHIEQLIHDLCPSGVPYKTLGEVCAILDSMRKPVSKELRSKGKYPYYGANGILDYVNDYIFDGTYLLVGEDGSVIKKDKSPVLQWATGKFWVNNHAHVLVEIKREAKLRYLYYILSTADVSGIVRGTPPKINQQNLKQIQIPLPPLPIQEEIVRILDTFTELITNIDTEIQKQQCELDLCRKQIFHQLNCKYEQLSSIFDMRGGYTPSTKNSEYWTDNTGYSWYTMDDIRKNGRKLGNSMRHITETAIKSKGLFPQGTIVFATSATIGEHAILMKPALTNQRFTAIIPKKDDVYMMFYYHYAFIIDEWCLQHIKRGGFNSVDMDGFAKLPIPLPPLSEQRAIAEKLDTFEKLITNLKTERDLRQQQYEYYREKLINLLK